MSTKDWKNKEVTQLPQRLGVLNLTLSTSLTSSTERRTSS